MKLHIWLVWPIENGVGRHVDPDQYNQTGQTPPCRCSPGVTLWLYSLTAVSYSSSSSGKLKVVSMNLYSRVEAKPSQLKLAIMRISQRLKNARILLYPRMNLATDQCHQCNSSFLSQTCFYYFYFITVLRKNTLLVWFEQETQTLSWGFDDEILNSARIEANTRNGLSSWPQG